MRWHRYIESTGSVTTHEHRAGYHQGHAMAYSDAMFAGRAAPHGPRSLWTRTTRNGNDG
jgi:hypothetical protein